MDAKLVFLFALAALSVVALVNAVGEEKKIYYENNKYECYVNEENCNECCNYRSQTMDRYERGALPDGSGICHCREQTVFEAMMRGLNYKKDNNGNPI